MVNVHRRCESCHMRSHFNSQAASWPSARFREFPINNDAFMHKPCWCFPFADSLHTCGYEVTASRWVYGPCGEATAWQRPINGRFLTPADHNDGSVMSMFMETQQKQEAWGEYNVRRVGSPWNYVVAVLSVIVNVQDENLNVHFLRKNARMSLLVVWIHESLCFPVGFHLLSNNKVDIISSGVLTVTDWFDIALTSNMQGKKSHIICPEGFTCLSRIAIWHLCLIKMYKKLCQSGGRRKSLTGGYKNAFLVKCKLNCRWKGSLNPASRQKMN